MSLILLFLNFLRLERPRAGIGEVAGAKAVSPERAAGQQDSQFCFSQHAFQETLAGKGPRELAHGKNNGTQTPTHPKFQKT